MNILISYLKKEIIDVYRLCQAKTLNRYLIILSEKPAKKKEYP